MVRPKTHPAGTFCWIDLATTDPAAAKAFYTELMGWRAEDAPMPGSDQPYTMLYLGEHMASALYPMMKELREAGVPSHWECYVAVEDIDAAAARVEAAGGKVLKPPFDVEGVARMAPVTDPDGAAFNLYQAKGEVGFGVKEEPGAFAYCELYANDPGAAAKFYGTVLGWTMTESTSADGHPYYQLGPEGRSPVAGMMKLRPEWGGMPPTWAVYLQVAELNQTLAAAESLGGKMLMPPMTAPGVGTFALLADPTGASFLAFEPKMG